MSNSFLKNKMYNPSEIVSTNMLSSYLRTSPESLITFTNGTQEFLDWKNFKIHKIPTNHENGYYSIQKFYIPKKNKKLGFRIVYKLRQQFTIDILKNLKYNLDNLYKPEICVHGFVKNRNTFTNAKCHIGKKFLLKLDIKDFFDTINIESVKNAFEFLGFSSDIASTLSKISTLNNKLAQGFPTSPIIANIVCIQMDKDIHELCKSHNATYTRYADDISISSDSFFQEKEHIESILFKYGFKLNVLKSQRFKKGQNLYVTGLSIADNLYPRIPKSIKHKLRQHLHYIDLYGYHSHICHINGYEESISRLVTAEEERKLRNYLKGWIDYINSIEPILAKIFYDKFNKIEETRKERYAQHPVNLQNEKGVIKIKDLSDLIEYLNPNAPT